MILLFSVSTLSVDNTKDYWLVNDPIIGKL